MGILDNVVNFSIKKNISKWIKGGATALVAAGVPLIAKHTGVELSQEQQAALTVAIGSAIVGVANLVKTKFPQLPFSKWL